MIVLQCAAKQLLCEFLIVIDTQHDWNVYYFICHKTISPKDQIIHVTDLVIMHLVISCNAALSSLFIWMNFRNACRKNVCLTTKHLTLWPHTGISLTLVYSSTNMSKSVWTSGFWKPLVHKNMSNFWNKIFHKLGLHFPRICILRTINVWTSELWCGRVTFLNHSSTIRVPKNP